MKPRFVRCAAIVFGLSLACALAGCGSDDGADQSSTTAAAKGVDDVAEDAGASDDAPADCAALTDATGKMYVNWQLVAQLGRQADLSLWPTDESIVGTLPEFADQLDTIEAQIGAGASVAKEIEFMRGANAIVQQGIGGDSTAPAALADYLGDDMVATLARKTAILQASADAGC